MSKKLIISFITLCLLFVTTITTTFAFVTYLQSYVSNLSLSAQSQGYCEMSIDGENFTDNLDSFDIKKAIALKLGSTDLSCEYIEALFNSIKLSPLTTSNGRQWYYYNLEGDPSLVSLESKMYISFDLYFRSKVNTPFYLYFNTDEINTDMSDKTTSINSSSTIINEDIWLSHNFNTYDLLGNKLTISPKGESIKVYAKDAIRFSTEVDGNIKIYEPSVGLGSYATDLDSEDLPSSYKKYTAPFDKEKNASFTYVKNNGYEGLYLPYEAIPSFYKGFEELDALRITHFSRYQEVKKVTFTFWLEGFDADCLDVVIDHIINVSLSFRGSQNIETYQLNYHVDKTVYEVEYVATNLRNGNLPLILTKEGYKFGGWYLDESYEIPYDFDVTPLAKVTDLYLNWI